MIIYHNKNLAAFKGNHVIYWGLQPLNTWRISSTSAAAAFQIAWAIKANTLIGGL